MRSPNTFGPVKSRLIELSRKYLDDEINDAQYFQELMREIYTAEHRSRALDIIAYSILEWRGP